MNCNSIAYVRQSVSFLHFITYLFVSNCMNIICLCMSVRFFFFMQVYASLGMRAICFDAVRDLFARDFFLIFEKENAV